METKVTPFPGLRLGWSRGCGYRRKYGVGHKTIFNAKWLFITVTYYFGVGVMKAVHT